MCNVYPDERLKLQLIIVSVLQYLKHVDDASIQAHATDDAGQATFCVKYMKVVKMCTA